jgi:hypothetical protein
MGTGLRDYASSVGILKSFDLFTKSTWSSGLCFGRPKGRAGYDRKESIKRAVFGDPAKFCDNLQKYARKLMESRDYNYYLDFIDSYENSCSTHFRSDKFEILPGHLDLLIAIISDK